jgi:hypothetical protein
MIDAPCGAMIWMPILLQRLSSETNKTFSYFGADVVESVVNASIKKFQEFKNEWKFEAIDFTRQQFPPGYDIIFSRDSLMHLPFAKAIAALRMFASTRGVQYLLIGSYLNGQNKNINIGEWYPIKLTDPPFNLRQYVEVFDEEGEDTKQLILYDVRNYLSKVDFDQMFTASLVFKNS